ncbi:12263_t:CDS:1 [Acaulospora morrowiae]|uniref:12263_t:CDS:1 n=1 Tax=Acaulospora morrowiae TaxID=94023 RepID=A0A9N9CL51_9GLOM|nr:12263_t:CDS:1 [Acaulospora morrowiae]
MGSCTSKSKKKREHFTNTLQARGEILGADLRAMFNNPVYSDIIITCKDGGVVYGSKLLLAARSDVFARILLNPAKAESENEGSELIPADVNIINISFPEFTSSTLLIVLEYLYMGSITQETLSLNNVVEAYLCSEYFMIPQLEEIIITFLDNALRCSADNNLSARLLSQAAECMLPSSDDSFFRTMYNCLATTSLETVDYENLNEAALRFILSPICGGDADEEFVTPEYSVFRYTVLWSAHKISSSLVSYFEPLLPPADMAERLDAQKLNQLRSLHEKRKKKSKSMEIQKSIDPILSPLLSYVNFNLIHPSILINIIEPLDIILPEILAKAFRWQTQLPPGSGPKRSRGIITAKHENLKLHWDQKAHGKKIVLLEHGTIVKSQSRNFGFARTSLPIRGYEVYEWDFIIEEPCKHTWIGVCSIRDNRVNYSTWLGGTSYGWVLGSNGYLAHNKGGVINENSRRNLKNYGLKFTKGTIITMHLNMENRTLAYSINGINFGEAFGDLPNEVYPAVSIKRPGKIKIQSHKKTTSMISMGNFQENSESDPLSSSL